MNLTQRAIDLVKRFEGCRLKAYRCPAGRWTIGFGHTAGVKPGLRISQAEADALLLADLTDVAVRLRPLIAVALADNQFSALVAFAFNVGVSAAAGSSVLHRVNEGRFDEVPVRLALWVRAGGKVQAGLVRRRKAEAELWSRA